ncbi:MAG: hypothetical protein HC913_20605 [Microscillaceae bacterium]|nr:hypothetical protein [Microscillaceae bacterium]
MEAETALTSQKGRASPVQEDYTVLGMTCAACVVSVNSLLSTLPGVEDVRVNLTEKRVWITYLPARVQRTDFQKALEKLGYQLLLTQSEAETAKIIDQDLQKLWHRTALALLLAALVMVLEMGLGHTGVLPYTREISMVLTACLLFFPGRAFFFLRPPVKSGTAPWAWIPWWP